MPFSTNNTNQNPQNNNSQNNNMVISHVQEEQINELNQLLELIEQIENNSNNGIQNSGGVNGAATGEDEHILSVAKQASEIYQNEVYGSDGNVYKLDDLLNDNYYYGL